MFVVRVTPIYYTLHICKQDKHGGQFQREHLTGLHRAKTVNSLSPRIYIHGHGSRKHPWKHEATNAVCPTTWHHMISSIRHSVLRIRYVNGWCAPSSPIPVTLSILTPRGSKVIGLLSIDIVIVLANACPISKPTLCLPEASIASSGHHDLESHLTCTFVQSRYGPRSAINNHRIHKSIA